MSKYAHDADCSQYLSAVRDRYPAIYGARYNIQVSSWNKSEIVFIFYFIVLSMALFNNLTIILPIYDVKLNRILIIVIRTILYCVSSSSSAGGFCDLMYRVKNTFLPDRLVASACGYEWFRS